MNEKSWRFRSHSGNRKSKTYNKPFGWAQDKLRQTIESPKSVVLLGLAITFAMCGAAAHGQQAKVPMIGLLSLRGSGYESFQRELRKLGYMRAKTSLSNSDPLIISSTGSPAWLMSWSVSKSTYSSRARRPML
jgi:hypothetical protein